ncbi:hypothetical protein L1987_86946 [Smallanthus sonchifolius]|uniref:Uncharacterized protein n=1 Tax=Smallanthus sonchifolius TaxID=185202 RepID=A0ACB8Y1B3_9ASTR|nr:hypothetical protein L1987_86946 [Smallanthus sonchifolius]
MKSSLFRKLISHLIYNHFTVHDHTPIPELSEQILSHSVEASYQSEAAGHESIKVAMSRGPKLLPKNMRIMLKTVLFVRYLTNSYQSVFVRSVLKNRKI